jgi:hypothetical protein
VVLSVQPDNMSSFIPKQYGLILKKPAVNGPNAAKKPAVKSVFADDDDDDGNVAGQSVMAKVRACVCVCAWSAPARMPHNVSEMVWSGRLKLVKELLASVALLMCCDYEP